MAKKAFVYDGSQWVDIAQSTTDLTNYANLTTTSIGGLRNLVINGDMRIWQRGTTGVTATNNATGYVADRWQTYRSAYAAGVDVSQVSSTGLTNFKYALRNQRVSGNTSTAAIAIVNNFESENSIPLAGRTITLSAWIRVGANFSGTLEMGPYTGTGTDQRRASGFTGASSVMTTISPTTSWARYTATATLDANITQASVFFSWTPTGTAGTNDWIDITGVQLELGSIATPFEQRPIGIELALCQRYYWRSEPDSYFGNVVSAGTFDFRVDFPVEMRIRPVSDNNISSIVLTISPTATQVNVYNGAFTTAPTTYGGGATMSSKKGGVIRFSGGGGGVNGFAGRLLCGTSVYFDFNAEL